MRERDYWRKVFGILRKGQKWDYFVFTRAMRREMTSDALKLDAPSKIVKMMVAFGVLRCVHEHFWTVTLDAKMKPLSVHLITEGTPDSTLVHPRDVLRPAIVNRAQGIVVIHNHPSGDPRPSHDDVGCTNRLNKACELMGIELIDHVVIGDEDRWVSLRKNDLIDKSGPMDTGSIILN